MEMKKGRILEISQATNPNGRRNVKFVLHEIYPDNSKWNSNGITYLEQYTRDNAETIKGMPLCAEFLDNEKDVPYGHGLTGQIENMPVFEDSVQVGCFENWSIEDIDIDGEIHRCLCAIGYVNEGRYPKFVKWMEDQISAGEVIKGSVEFVGTKENDGEIIYDGGWKEQGRIPMVYDYSGYCILSVKPSDSTAVLLELNQFKNNMEDFEMNEELREYLSEMQSNILTRLGLNAQIEELEKTVAELNDRIEELNSTIAEKDATIAEINEKVIDAEKAVQDKEVEMNDKCKELNESIANYEAELAEIKKANRIAELNAALEEYTDEQKNYAKDEIEAFNADPFAVEINSITTKIDAASYKAMRKAEEKKTVETNSLKDEFDGILAGIDPIKKEDEVVEDFDCFA